MGQMQGPPPGWAGYGPGFGGPGGIPANGQVFGGAGFGGGPNGGWMPGSPSFFPGNPGSNFGGGSPFDGSSMHAFGDPSANAAVVSGAQQASFQAMNQFVQTVLDPFVGGRDARSPAQHSEFDENTGADAVRVPWNVWATSFGEAQTTNATPGATSSGVYGTVVGTDLALSDRTTIGFALSGGSTYFNSGFTSDRSNLFQAAGFVRQMIGNGYVSAALAYGWQDIGALAISDRLNPVSDARSYSSRFESGYRFALPGLGVTPYAAGQVTSFQLTADMMQALAGHFGPDDNGSGSSVIESRSELGFRTDKSFAMQSGTLTLRGRFAWVHDFNPDKSMPTLFQTPMIPGLALNGVTQAPDATLTSGSAELRLPAGWLAALTFQGEFSDLTRSYAGKGFVRYVW